MKKYFFITALLIPVQFLCAQKNKVGITAGATLANMKSVFVGEPEKSGSKIGFTAGIMADIEMEKNLSFQPMLNFTQKGFKETNNSNGNKQSAVLNLNYLELPLNIIYTVPANKHRFFIGGGPSLSMGLSGKLKYKSSAFPDENEDISVKFGSNEEEDDFKSFDGGINVTTGIYLNNTVLIALNYYHGLSNLLINGNSDNSFRNRFFGLRIGYVLKTKASPKN
jgi:Outer membrane protein beta-barrel domain